MRHAYGRDIHTEGGGHTFEGIYTQSDIHTEGPTHKATNK